MKKCLIFIVSNFKCYNYRLVYPKYANVTICFKKVKGKTKKARSREGPRLDITESVYSVLPFRETITLLALNSTISL